MHTYIGVTGFTEAAQVTRALRAVPKNSDRRFMVGVLASAKSLRGIPLKPEWRSRYPEIACIREIFPDDPRALNLVHYAPSKKHRKDTSHDLITLSDVIGSRLHGFQINAAWPREADLGVYRECGYLRQTVVLQIGREAIQEMDSMSMAIAERVNLYGGLIDGVLIDASGGMGVPFDPAFARVMISRIRARRPELGIGIAGGISLRTLDRVRALLEEFPDLNIDAESGLRTDDDALDEEAVGLYVRRAYAALPRPGKNERRVAHVAS